jgi:hypothetical protein
VSATLFGAPANPPTVTVTIHGAGDEYMFPAVLNDSTGQYHADGVIPLTAKPGPWSGIWYASGSGPGNNSTGPFWFNVQALPF